MREARDLCKKLRNSNERWRKKRLTWAHMAWVPFRQILQCYIIYMWKKRKHDFSVWHVKFEVVVVASLNAFGPFWLKPPPPNRCKVFQFVLLLNGAWRYGLRLRWQIWMDSCGSMLCRRKFGRRLQLQPEIHQTFDLLRAYRHRQWWKQRPRRLPQLGGGSLWWKRSKWGWSTEPPTGFCTWQAGGRWILGGTQTHGEQTPREWQLHPRGRPGHLRRAWGRRRWSSAMCWSRATTRSLCWTRPWTKPPSTPSLCRWWVECRRTWRIPLWNSWRRWSRRWRSCGSRRMRISLSGCRAPRSTWRRKSTSPSWWCKTAPSSRGWCRDLPVFNTGCWASGSFEPR